ncbi:TFIIH basal transcription factor complex subunit SSL1 [Fomitopsis serialis]|uniref:TFIIH basal transcription factor complex subunit SSL1 n=1 Tax=Fomitopsis serialis TaxID=139415 RepID=UPI0020086C09|nr:TFIIH basal transcription factor complex subunit SSL1 [Neoantrodia serialis]KAH9935541.1 TFIIH basal transcription factor complex subunit SSL1 [Neoantrodia serialis]
MPPRRIEPGFNDGDSDSDVDLFDDFDSSARSKAKGKGKAIDRARRTRGRGRPRRCATTPAQPYAWEASYTRSWDTVQEDEAGSLQSAVEDLIARGRRRRCTTRARCRYSPRHYSTSHPTPRLSSAMMDRDMRPTRFDLMLQYVREFVTEWFDQNPLGQIGVVGMRAGIGERLGEMSGNPQEVLKAISERHKLEPTGEPSLQNAVEMARSSMSHLPTHSSREIIVIFGSLTTCDPGNIHDTLAECVKDRIRISVVALAAEMKICRELCDKTGGQFGVALNEGHFKDLLFELIPPPAQRALNARGGAAAPADLMLMGFPTRLPDTSPPSLCACHSQLKSEGFLCPRCGAKVCDVPTDCDICGLMIVSSPHLARSYHHLFPVKTYQAVMNLDDTPDSGSTCHACARPFKDAPQQTAGAPGEGMSPLGRYRCPDCRNDFCAECDVFVHDVVHCCPGCGK